MSEDPHIPDELSRALKGAFPGVDVPERIDRAVLTGARAHLLKRRWKPLVGVAAAVALVGGIAFVTLRTHESPRQMAIETAPLRVTILDALSAARRGDASAADQIAKRAVTLEGLP